MLRKCYGPIRTHPKDAGRVIIMLVGTLSMLILAVIIYGLTAAFEKITGKDYLNERAKRRFQKEKE